jgi:Putative zinc-finger
MCEYSGRLIAWLDQELPDQEGIDVEAHVGRCAECRKAVSAYQEVSAAFLSCYQAAMIARPRRNAPWRASVGVATGVAAAAVIAGILLVQPRLEKLPIRLPSPPHAPSMAFEKPAPPPPAMAVRLRPAMAPAPPIHRLWIADEPVVEVSLPADALFPPGAVPQGFHYIADVHFQQ